MVGDAARFLPLPDGFDVGATDADADGDGAGGDGAGVGFDFDGCGAIVFETLGTTGDGAGEGGSFLVVATGVGLTDALGWMVWFPAMDDVVTDFATEVAFTTGFTAVAPSTP